MLQLQGVSQEAVRDPRRATRGEVPHPCPGAYLIMREAVVNPILTRRGNTLFPRQPIRRTWGQLGEQLDRVVGAAGFVHRRKSKETTASE